MSHSSFGQGFKVPCLFLALEATFSFVLWAMRSRTKDYGMPALYPCSRDALVYDGCCSRAALLGHSWHDDENLAPEQLEARSANCWNDVLSKPGSGYVPIIMD